MRLQDGVDPVVVDMDPRVLDLVQRERPGLRILPLVQNYKDEHWDPELLTRAIADENARARLVTALTDFVIANKFAGVCIDFEEVPPTTQGALLQFMQNSTQLLRLVVAGANSALTFGLEISCMCSSE